jgi:hypothetical protein
MIEKPAIWIGTWYPNDDSFEPAHIGVFAVLPHDTDDIRKLNLNGSVEGVLAASDFDLEECTPEKLDKFIQPWLEYAVKHELPWNYDSDILYMADGKLVLFEDE